jgi:hypothetical protein
MFLVEQYLSLSLMKRVFKYLIFFALLISFGGGFSSCKSMRLDHASRMERKAIRSANRIQNKENKKFTKQYDKKYKRQTKIQNEQQENRIKQARKKPINMGRRQRSFFLWRWLGI